VNGSSVFLPTFFPFPLRPEARRLVNMFHRSLRLHRHAACKPLFISQKGSPVRGFHRRTMALRTSSLPTVPCPCASPRRVGEDQSGRPTTPALSPRGTPSGTSAMQRGTCSHPRQEQAAKRIKSGDRIGRKQRVRGKSRPPTGSPWDTLPSAGCPRQVPKLDSCPLPLPSWPSQVAAPWGGEAESNSSPNRQGNASKRVPSPRAIDRCRLSRAPRLNRNHGPFRQDAAAGGSPSARGPPFSETAVGAPEPEARGCAGPQ